jgi:hypothetical protein
VFRERGWGLGREGVKSSGKLLTPHFPPYSNKFAIDSEIFFHSLVFSTCSKH